MLLPLGRVSCGFRYGYRGCAARADQLINKFTGQLKKPGDFGLPVALLSIDSENAGILLCFDTSRGVFPLQVN
jgi:hypothetical protein